MSGDGPVSCVVASPVGTLAVEAEGGAITAVHFVCGDVVGKETRDAGLARAVVQLQRYFDDPMLDFDLPLAMQGTAFQQRVWAALREIPAGETRSYGEIARQLGSSPRAVGNACRRNPCPIVVPCHRVVSVSGVGGYAGATGGRLLAIKRWLLRHEGVNLGG